MRTRVILHPFTTISYRKQPRPAATFVAKVIRCAGTGGDPAAIDLLPAIFVDGTTQKALTRQLTNSEACDYHPSNLPTHLNPLRIARKPSALSLFPRSSLARTNLPLSTIPCGMLTFENHQLRQMLQKSHPGATLTPSISFRSLILNRASEIMWLI